MALLTANGLTKRFGGLLALKDLELTIQEKTIHSVIGPNGAGKTTVFNCLTGFSIPDQGEIIFLGQSIHGMRPDQIARWGIARTYQNIRLFANMTTSENVILGMHGHLQTNLFDALFQTPRYWQEEYETQKEAQRLLAFVGLEGKEAIIAANLSYGDQRRLEIARALALRPKLLLLDEPAAGMNPRETNEMLTLTQRLRDELGLTILLIEHHMKVVMTLSDMITVIDFGQKIAEGQPSAIQANPQVIAAYLGGGASTA